MKINLIFYTCFLVLGSCKTKKEHKEIYTNEVSGRFALINDSSQTGHWINKEIRSFWIPDQSSFHIADSLMLVAIQESKQEFPNLNAKTYFNYYKQCLCYKDPNGDSIMYINAFRDIPEIPKDSAGNLTFVKINWATQFVKVHDGGDHFFRIMINLSQKKYFEFVTHGLG